MSRMEVVEEDYDLNPSGKATDGRGNRQQHGRGLKHGPGVLYSNY